MDLAFPGGMEALAGVMRFSIYSGYIATLVGNQAPITRQYNDRARALRVGDLVTEASTIYRLRPGCSHLDAVGILEEITREKVQYFDPDFVWDEEAEGRPHPTEEVYYIRTLDGRRFRWTNASFVAAVSNLDDLR